MRFSAALVCFLFLFSCNTAPEPADTNAANDTAARDSVAAPVYVDSLKIVPDAGSETGYNLMDNETVGKLQIGLDDESIVAEIGKPDSKSAAELWEADGLYHEYWTYTKAGIELNLTGENASALEIFSIRFFSPCTLKTSRGIGIGSSFAQVKEAYKNEIADPNANKESLVAGSIYGGIVFDFKKGKLSNVFIGAAAE